MPTLTLLQAEGLVVRTLTRCRTNVENARSVARALVAAEADGTILTRLVSEGEIKLDPPGIAVAVADFYG